MLDEFDTCFHIMPDLFKQTPAFMVVRPRKYSKTLNLADTELLQYLAVKTLNSVH